jgi:hypothetical protein
MGREVTSETCPAKPTPFETAVTTPDDDECEGDADDQRH